MIHVCIHELLQKHIHKINFYSSADNFTQALPVMLVTNITSEIAVWFKFKHKLNL